MDIADAAGGNQGKGSQMQRELATLIAAIETNRVQMQAALTKSENLTAAIESMKTTRREAESRQSTAKNKPGNQRH